MTDIADRASAGPQATARTEKRTLSRNEMVAWRQFLRAHARITRQLETELVAEQKLSLAAYDVLVQLSEAPGHQLRMTELADAVLLSRSGVTRLVDRMEKVGLVVRLPVETDGRGVAARLTDAGLQRLRIAARTHFTGIARHFADKLGESDLAAIEGISRRLAG